MKKRKMPKAFSDRISKIDFVVAVIAFKEGNTHILFCPALDLSGYGNTASEASESFEVSVSEYLNYTTKKGTLLPDLKKLGWTIQKKSDKLIASPPEMSELLESNNEFNRIFNHFPFKKFDRELSLPLTA